MLNPSSSHQQCDPAQIFAALGDVNRLRLMEKLSDGQPQSITRLTADFQLTRQALSKHLRVLEQVGLVQAQRVGREMRFSFVPNPVGDIRSYLDTICKQWDDTLSRLKSFAEE